RMAALHWQGVEQERLGGWLLRAADGFTGRANSVLPVGDPGLPAEAALAKVVAWYRERGLSALVALPAGFGDPPDALEALLAESGWSLRSSPAIVMTARTEVIAGLPCEHEIGFADEPDESWLATYRFSAQPLPAVAKAVLLSAPVQVFASVRRDGRTIATGRLSVAAGWAGITAVEVAPDWRRAGLATSVTAALAAEAAGRGIEHVFLQVGEDNATARALYTRCGFTPRHRYHYRVAPPV
ncbi:MAG: GNAT family N-acetyltransferase, partial [Streptosporangiaceae bacterium]